MSKPRTINESNVIIAKFMGWTEMEGTAGQCYESTKHPFDTIHVDDLRYYHDWNKLMEVIEVINRTGKAGGVLYDIHEGLKAADIVKTWNEIVKFIDWYNTLK